QARRPRAALGRRLRTPRTAVCASAAWMARPRAVPAQPRAQPSPVAAADVCRQDVLWLLRRLGVTRLDRLYAYSVGAHVATRLFASVQIAEGVLLAGGGGPSSVPRPPP